MEETLRNISGQA